MRCAHVDFPFRPPAAALSWIELPTGRFEMGAGVDVLPDEGPARDVSVGSLWLSPRITVALFGAFVDDFDHVTTAEQEGTGFVVDNGLVSQVPNVWWQRPQADSAPGDPSPVCQVSWFDAVEFARWSHTRLPTEAEWEYAATLNAVEADGFGEWCADWFDPIEHRSEQRVNPTGPKSGITRVVRGTSTRFTERASQRPDFSSNRLGFRVVAGQSIRSGGPDRLAELWA